MAAWRLALAPLLAISAGGAGPNSDRLILDLHLPDHVVAKRKAREAAAAANGVLVDGRRLRSLHVCELGNYDNVQYHLKITVGEACSGGSEQRFQVVPDTGSSDLWIPAANCTQCRGQASRFKLDQSCSAKFLGDRITFKYGDGTMAAGSSFEDTVHIGDLAAKGQFMIQVDTMQSDTHMKSDGILGLAHHYQGTTEEPNSAKGETFLTTIFKEHPEMPRQFSFFLTGSEDKPSKLIFGDANLQELSKETSFRYGKGAYMEETALWLTSIWSIGWSNTGVEVAFPERGVMGSPALVDSGSSLIVLAPEIYDHLMEELKWRFSGCRELTEQQIITCDCPPANDLSRIPWLVINVINEADEQFSLCMSPDEYILESADVADPGRSTCVPSLQRGSDGQPVPLIFGMTFMRVFYTSFDVEHKRIGFARSNLSPLPPLVKCTVDAQPVLRRTLWVASIFVALFSVLFACYVVWVPSLAPEHGCCKARVDPEA